ncbi:MAG TPA: hypothetical protein VFV97_10120 [Rhodanobacteraceae bacterium]|nr:hypothetical protein [Rhodanobacteraceae bacterium]
MTILRRAIQSLRRQDWMAVLVELIVVVLGVFIGVQASNWNADAETERKSAAFTERLKGDLRIEAWGYEMQVGYYSQVLHNASVADDALTGKAPLSDEALLIAAYRATQYNSYIRRRATYDELTSTGEIGLVRDEALRTLAMYTYSSDLFNEVIDNSRGSEYRIAFRKLMPHDVQTALREHCGDLSVPVGQYEGIETVLDHPCSTGLPIDVVARSAAMIRTDANLAATLRLRIADLETGIANLTFFFKDDLRDRLKALAKETP